jgi:molybdopterin synthase catalytic subunit
VIRLTAEPLDPRALEAAVAWPGAGAVCTFVGLVRDNNLGRAVGHLEYEAYPEMAEAAMAAIAEDVRARWPGARVALAHRLGRLELGAASVVIAVATPHRAEAFAACRHAIDALKATVPIWKKEVWADGSAWIEGVPPHPLG